MPVITKDEARFLPAVVLLCLCLLTGCGVQYPLTEEDGSVVPSPQLRVSQPNYPVSLGEYQDTLADMGIYYATWTMGERETITDEEGKESTRHPVQIYVLTGLVTLVALLPFVLGVFYAIMTSSILVLLPVCVIGGIFAGPGVAMLYDAVLRCLRDDVLDRKANFFKAFRQNWRGALIPGIVSCLFWGFFLSSVMLLWRANQAPGLGTVLLFAAAIVMGVGSVFWSQLVLFDLSPKFMVKNCLLFSLRYARRFWGVTVLKLVWWGVGALFLPYSLLLVPVIGLWFSCFLSTFLLYPALAEAFQIEKAE